MYDDLALTIINENKNMLVPWYLMASYAYYINDSPIISDEVFDSFSNQLQIHWNNIEHIHKEYITIGDLKAGTFLGKYPSRIKYALKYIKPKLNTLEDFIKGV